MMIFYHCFIFMSNKFIRKIKNFLLIITGLYIFYGKSVIQGFFDFWGKKSVENIFPGFQ
jgi:hypothetical protein